MFGEIAAYTRTFQSQVLDQCVYLFVLEAKVGHGDFLVAEKELRCRWVPFCQHLVRFLDPSFQPAPIAPFGYAQKIRPQALVSAPDGVTRLAARFEQVVALGEVGRIGNSRVSLCFFTRNFSIEKTVPIRFASILGLS